MFFRKLFLHLKGLRFIAFIPLLILNILFPLSIYVLISLYGKVGTLYVFIIHFISIFLPFCSVWWMIFVSREYVENDGNELLFVTKPRIMIAEYLVYYVIFLLNVFIVFLIMNAVLTPEIPSILREFFRFVCISSVFFGISYTSLYLTNSITLTILTEIIYTLIVALIPTQKVNAFFYLSNVRLNAELIKTVCIPQLAIGIILTVTGYFLNLNYKKFN